MEKTIQKIPFLRLVIALALGISLGSYVPVPLKYCVVILLFTPVFLLLIQKNYRFQFNSLFGTGIHFFFIFLGIFSFRQFNTTPEFYDKGKFIATIIETPLEKPNSYKSLININAFYSSDSVFETNEMAVVYFEKEENFPELKPGEVILCNQTTQFLKNNGNPLEFDYKKYLSRKKIYRQVYLSGKNWKKSGNTNASITTNAENLREKLLTIYRSQPIDQRELEILSALTLGYKRDMDPETKRVFSSAGAMHVLAVSGLHVGIIFLVISFLLGFLRKQKSGRFLFVILTISILWGYAIITGLSPSVMRAAAMFTIFVIGENLQRKANIYNSLAASAFFLLLLNPNNLFDIGFQLSYSAVFGIVYLQPKLKQLFTFKYKIVQSVWLLLTVSVAAQIATFPLSAYYFNQFPSYFWITNCIVIPSVIVLIPAGIGLLLVSKIPLLSSIIAFILNHLIKLIYGVLSFIDQLPFSALPFAVSAEQFLILSAILFSLFLFLKNYHPFYLKLTLSFTLLLTVLTLLIQINRLNKNTLIVYNSTENSSVHLIHGKINYIISEKKIDDNDFMDRIIWNTIVKLGLDAPVYLLETDTLINKTIFFKNGIGYFEGKSILIGKIIPEITRLHHPDFIVNPPKIPDTESETEKSVTIITNKRYFKKNNAAKTHIHFTNIDGAFRENW